MSGADVAGVIGLGLVCLGIVATLVWPSYDDEQDFATPADRARAEEQVKQHRQGKSPTAA